MQQPHAGRQVGVALIRAGGRAGVEDQLPPLPAVGGGVVVPQNYHPCVGEDAQGDVLEVAELRRPCEDVEQLLFDIFRPVAVAVGQPNRYPFEGQAAVAGETFEPEDVPVAPHGIHRGDLLEPGDDSREADVPCMEDGGHPGLLECGNRLGREFPNPVGDVGVGDDAKREHGANIITKPRPLPAA